ncbi:MAG: glucosaminidase domain-containing protein [Bacilli bacterium]
MPEIRIVTSADLRGFDEIEARLEKLKSKARDVAKEFQGINVGGGGPIQAGASPIQAGQTVVQGRSAPISARPATMASGGSRPVASASSGGGTGGYNLNTTSGVVSYYENVLNEAMPIISRSAGNRNGMSNVAGVRYQGRPVQQTVQQEPVTGHQMRSLFGGLSRQFATMDAQSKASYIAAEQGGGSRSRAPMASMPGMVPILGSRFKSKHLPGSTPYYEDWFNRVGQQDAQSLMSPSLKQSYAEANNLYIAGRKNTPAEFYQNYASEANQPAPIAPIFLPQTRMQRLRQHWMNNAKGNTLGSVLGSGLKGALGGTAIDAMIGGGDGAAAGGLAAGTIGALAGGPLGMIAAVGMQSILGVITGVFKSGFANWQQTAPTSSQIAHGLGTVGQGANVLNLSIQRAAAAFGIAGTSALQSAQRMTQAFGGNNASVTNLTGQAAKFAMYNGLSDQQQTQLMTTMGQLGITSGRGATLSAYSANRMMAQLAQTSGMQGRQGPFMTGLASVYGGLGAMNPIISNPLNTAGIYASMNASGIQGLQGMRGAQLMSTMNSSLASPGGLAQLMGFSAINRASGGKITNPWQMQSIMEQGVGARIGNTTLGAQLSKMVKSMGGGNIYTESAMLAATLGISENQAKAMLQSRALGAGPARVPTGPLHMKTTQADKHAIAAAQSAYQKAKTGQTGGIMSTAWDRAQATVMQAITHLPGDLGAIPNQVTSILSGSYLNHSPSQMAPYALKVSKATGIPAADLLAQWMHESAWGTSTAARLNENLAGIKPSAAHPAGKDAKYAGYSSLAQFAQADIQTLMQPRYAHARLLAQHGASAQAVFSALASEGYTGSPTTAQANAYGSDVQAIVNQLVAQIKAAMDSSLSQHRQAQKRDRAPQGRGPWR